MPAGLSPDDSTRFARAFIRGWIDSRLVEDVAAEAVDMKAIEEMVAQYRRDLIMRGYRDRMFASDAGSIVFSDSLVNDYYGRHIRRLSIAGRATSKGITDPAGNTAETSSR